LPRKTLPAKSAADDKFLLQRVRAEASRGNTTQALNLARQLCRQSPSVEHDRELRGLFLTFIETHLRKDSTADARKLLNEAEDYKSAEPDWWEKLATFRAKLGERQRVEELLARMPNTTVRPRLMAILADGAMADRQRGRELIAPEDRPAFDQIRLALAHYEKGNDTDAREALQGVGLQSPYLEWKVMIRGLIAWAGNEDAKAIENWSRLDAERMPSRLVAHLRAGIDPAYLASLPPALAKAAQTRLAASSHPILMSLQELQFLLASPDSFSKAFKKARTIVPMMKVAFPALAPRMMNCFYWLILQIGNPDDLLTYEQVFGPHPDDKKLNRLRAMMAESIPQFALAYGCFKLFEVEVAADTARWSGAAGKLARAMIFERMGRNAEEYEAAEPGDQFTADMLSDLMQGNQPALSKKASLSPNAEACYRQAVALAPDWPTATESLTELFAIAGRFAEVEEVASQFLKYHPDHADAMCELGIAQAEQNKTDEAIATFRKAVANNPLDRVLRTRLGGLFLTRARTEAAAADYGGVETSLREAIGHFEGLGGDIARAMNVAIACKRKLPDDAARSLAEFGPRAEEPSVAYLLMVEALRVKVPKSYQTETQVRFNAKLDAPLTRQQLSNLLQCLRQYRLESPIYRGIGPHEKRIFAVVTSWLAGKPEREELIELGFTLLQLELPKPLLELVKHGNARFKRDAALAYLTGEQAILQKPKSYSVRKVGTNFRQARNYLEDASDERSALILKAIDEHCDRDKRLEGAINGFDFFGFGGFGGGFFE